MSVFEELTCWTGKLCFVQQLLRQLIHIYVSIVCVYIYVNVNQVCIANLSYHLWDCPELDLRPPSPLDFTPPGLSALLCALRSLSSVFTMMSHTCAAPQGWVLWRMIQQLFACRQVLSTSVFIVSHFSFSLTMALWHTLWQWQYNWAASATLACIREQITIISLL